MTEATEGGPGATGPEALAGAPASSTSARLAAALLLAAAFVGMAIRTWGTWPDPLIDFGADPYTAWRLADGLVLGRDVAWAHTGPFPPYLQAALFAVFGPGLWVLFVANAAVLAAATALLVDLLAEVAGLAAATVAGLLLLLVFAFGQYTVAGNYNWIAPYTSGVTWGLLAALVALRHVHRFARDGRRWRLVAAGLALGLSFLTKPEVFLAAIAGAAVAWWIGRGRRLGAAREAVLLAAPLLGVVAIAWAALLPALGPAEAFAVTVRPWLVLAAGGGNTAFYEELSGLDRPLERLADLLRALGACALACGAAAALDRLAVRLPVGRRVPWIAGIAGAAAGLLPALLLVEPDAWFPLATALPALVAAGGLASALRLRAPGADRGRLALGLGLAVLALALLGKVALHARFDHYGFALAAPATLLVAAWAIGPLSAWLRERGGSGAAFRGAALGLLAAFSVAALQIQGVLLRQKVSQPGEGRDRFVADGRGLYVRSALDMIAAYTRPGDTLAVLPEGVMINYLARRPNPTPYVITLPVGLAFFGEQAVLDAYRRAPPDWILLVHRDAAEHGARWFGRDYAVGLGLWIAENYAQVGQVGAQPFQSNLYGMALLRRRSGEPR